MPSYGLEWVQHWLQPEEDRAAAEQWKARSKCRDIGTELMDRLFFSETPDPVDPPKHVPKPRNSNDTARLRKWAQYQEDLAQYEEYRAQLAEAKLRTKDGKAFCRGLRDERPCPVLMECLGYALEEELYIGVWGGTSGRERRKFKSDLQKQVAAWRMRRIVRR